MSDAVVRLTRETLYELVWAKTMRKLAEELSVSASSLGDACDQLGVPRPKVGYWTKLAYGQQPLRPPLDPCPEGSPHEVELAKSGAAASSSIPVVQLRPTLRSAHPEVEALRAALASRSPDQDGMRVLKGSWNCATVRVTDTTRDRALRVLDALGRALAERGHTLRFKAPSQAYGPFALEVEVAGEVVALAVAEPTKQRPHVPTPAQLESERLYGGLFTPRYDQIPSGQLVLRLFAPYGAARRSTWADGTIRRLEDLLGRVVLAIEATAATLQEERRTADARARAQEEELARRARTERVAQYQKALGDDLIDMATRWSKAETIRAFLDAVEDAVPAATRSAGLTAWLGWARTFQRSLDPVGTPGAIAKKLDPLPEATDGPAQARTRDQGAR